MFISRSKAGGESRPQRCSIRRRLEVGRLCSRSLLLWGRRSGSDAVPATSVGEDIHHFVEGCNLEIQDGAVGHEAVDYRSGRTEKLQLNIVLACPAIKKRKHSQAAAADRFHCGKIQSNDAGLGLRSHNIAKLENRFAMDNPALTFHNCEVAHVLDINGQHEILPLFIAKAIAVPNRLPYFSAGYEITQFGRREHSGGCHGMCSY